MIIFRAFAGIAAIESAYAIKYNLTKDQLIELSEQQMVDCVYGSPYHSKGCDGGTVYDVFKYALDFGVVKETDYPYLDRDNPRVLKSISKINFR